jgi:divalent metal cation (Fe/Co/Zn/Cd) transporter
LTITCLLRLLAPFPARSVAIMSDAAHMLSDVSAFLVAIFAAWAATQRSTWHYSFGYHRVEILGALISVLIIWMLSGALVVEAVQRVINPVRVDGKRECSRTRRGMGLQGREDSNSNKPIVFHVCCRVPASDTCTWVQPTVAAHPQHTLPASWYQ